MNIQSVNILPDHSREANSHETMLDYFLSFPIDKWKYLGPDFNRAKFNTRLKTLAETHENFSIANIQDIYSPLAEFFYVCYRDAMIVKQSRSHFLAMAEPITPFIIGVAGSVASGKSSLSFLLKSIFESFNEGIKVDVVSTDSFLLNNDALHEVGIFDKKGFPISYRRAELLKFVQDVSAGFPNLTCPVYSHKLGDIIPDRRQVIDRPNVLILEGLNILQTYHTSTKQESEFISDYFDVSLFLDVELQNLEAWYVDRFLTLARQAQADKTAAHHKYHKQSLEERIQTAKRIWNHVNAKNFAENILSSRQRADIIIHKTDHHMVDKIMISKHWL